MTVENSPSCYRIENSLWIKGGKKLVKEKRLVFQDRFSTPFTGILKRQTERWRKKNEVAEWTTLDCKNDGVIQGIKIHSKAMHIFCTLLEIVSIGLIVKSFKVTLNDKAIYFNFESYSLWRRLNGEALTALGVLKNRTKFQIKKGYQDEILQLFQILDSPINTRKLDPSITTSTNVFQTVTIAYKWASLRIKDDRSLRNKTPQELEIIRCRLAAFYILLTSKITESCTGPILSINDYVTAKDLFIDVTTYESMKTKKLNDLTMDEKNKIENITHAYELTGEVSTTEVLINNKPDIFSSSLILSDPVKAKGILEKLCKKDNTTYFRLSHYITESLFNSSFVTDRKTRQFLDHIERMGQALQSQFKNVNPHPLVNLTLKSIFFELVNRNLFTYDTIDNYGKPVAILCALKLLLNSTLISDNLSIYLSCPIQDENDLELTIPQRTFFEDDLENFVNPLFLSPLSGKLGEEQFNSTFTGHEAFDFAREKTNLFPEDLDLFSQFVEQKVVELIKNSPQKHSELRHLLSSRYISQPNKLSLDQLTKKFEELYDYLSQVGDLIYQRYWMNYGPGLIDLVQFEEETGLTKTFRDESILELISRTAEAHRKITKEYLRFTPVLPIRREIPKMDKPTVPVDSTNEYVDFIFQTVSTTSAPTGNCCVAALALCIKDQYVEMNRENSDAVDWSKNTALLRLVRSAVSAYMKDHANEIIDSHFTEFFTSEQLIERANTIERNENHDGWFTFTEVYVFSKIVGRPVYIVNAGNVRYDAYNQTIKMKKINDHFDADPIYLFWKHNHVDLLIPKRVGKQDLKTLGDRI